MKILPSLILIVSGLLVGCSTLAQTADRPPSDAVERGTASWYGKRFHGRTTASGEIYDMHGMTAAHKTLPLHTVVEVRNLRNDKRVVVRINDRGRLPGRVIDLSYGAAKKLGFIKQGLTPVEIRVLERPK